MVHAHWEFPKRKKALTSAASSAPKKETAVSPIRCDLSTSLDDVNKEKHHRVHRPENHKSHKRRFNF
jgi:hypothetical protein